MMYTVKKFSFLYTNVLHYKLLYSWRILRYKLFDDYCLQRFVTDTSCFTINDQICQKGSYTRTVSRHTFHRYLITTPMDQQHMCCLILLKVDQSAFTQASFSSLSDVHECLGGLHMPPCSLD